MQKANRRKSAIGKIPDSVMTEGRKKIVRNILILDLMSSEEETEDDGSRIFLVNPLPWVTDSYRKITKIADKYYEATKSKRARELTVERKSGTASIRPKPKKLPDNCKSFVI